MSWFEFCQPYTPFDLRVLFCAAECTFPIITRHMVPRYLHIFLRGPVAAYLAKQSSQICIHFIIHVAEEHIDLKVTSEGNGSGDLTLSNVGFEVHVAVQWNAKNMLVCII